jgi:hypothetical protein
LSEKTSLPPDKLRLALQRIGEWRLNRAAPVACPVCEAKGLEIIDRSTRPHAEWYVVACPSCGLGHTIHIPMASTMPRGD